MESINPSAQEHSWESLKIRLQVISQKLKVFGVPTSDLDLFIYLVDEKAVAKVPFVLRIFDCALNIEEGQDDVLLRSAIATFLQSVEEKLIGDQRHEIVSQEVREKMLALTEYQDLIKIFRVGYDQCLAALDTFRICHDGNFSITALDGKVYQLPSFVDIERALMANPELFGKIRSLMTLPRLILTPIGLPLKTQVNAADTKKLLNDRFGRNIQESIRITNPDADILPVKVSIISNPVQLLYFPERMPKKHQKSGAITKQECVRLHGGWLVSVIEGGDDSVQEDTIPFVMEGNRSAKEENYKERKEGIFFDALSRDGLRGICFDEYLMLYMLATQKLKCIDMRTCTAMLGNSTSDGRIPFGFFGSDSFRLRFDNSPGRAFRLQPLGRRAALTIPVQCVSDL